MIKVIIFDYGGVIAGTKSEKSGLSGLCDEFSKLLNLPGKKILDVYHRYWDDWKLGNLTMQEVYEKFLKDLNIKYDTKKLIEITLNSAKLDKKVYALVLNLKKHYRLACLTNHTREWFGSEVKRFKLNNLFEKIFTSYELKLVKPDPEIYKIVIRDLNVRPEECLFIDDLARNTRPAAELGIYTIVFHSYSQLKKELVKLGIKGV